LSIFILDRKAIHSYFRIYIIIKWTIYIYILIVCFYIPLHEGEKEIADLASLVFDNNVILCYNYNNKILYDFKVKNTNYIQYDFHKEWIKTNNNSLESLYVIVLEM